MAQQKISELPTAGTLDGTELVVINQAGETSTTTTQEIQDLNKTGGVSGTFLSANSPQKTITVVNGIITSIV